MSRTQFATRADPDLLRARTPPSRPPRTGAPESLFFLVYWVQKLSNSYQGLSKVPLRKTLAAPVEQGGLGLDAAAAGTFLTTGALGWYIKALFGAVTDRLPLFGYRRKSWLAVSSLATAAAWTWVALHGASTLLTLLVGVLMINVLIAFSDVVCDGLMVESGQAVDHARNLAAGTGSRRLQAAQMLGGTTAFLIAATLGGVIAQFFDLSLAAWISGALPLLVVAGAVFLVREEKVSWDWRSARGGFAALALAAAVGGAILFLKGLPSQSLIGRWQPLLSPLLVLGAVLLVTRVPRRMVPAFALMLLWAAIPFNPDSQYFYQYVTDHSAAVARELAADGPFRSVSVVLMDRLGVLDAEADADTDLAELFYSSVLLPCEHIGGLAGLLFFYLRCRRAALGRILVGVLMAAGATLGLYSAFALWGDGTLSWLALCTLCGGAVTAVANLAILVFAAGTVPLHDQATTFALLTGLSNLGSMLGVETVGNRLYSNALASGAASSLEPEKIALLAVLLAAGVFLVLLLALVGWLARRGLLTGRPDD